MKRRNEPTAQASFWPERPAEPFPDHVIIRGNQTSVTPVFYAYWRFAAERQRIFYRRLDGQTKALTHDPVLSVFKFTNAYRASDRVSQYLIRHVIYRDDLPSGPVDVFFRILLFKLFNKIETWNLLEEKLGALVWENFDVTRASSILANAMAEGQRIYSAAYIMPSAPFGHHTKHENHLSLLRQLIYEELPHRIGDTRSMAQAYELLLGAPSIGPFLAYQFVTDLNYSELLSFAEDEFVVAGPGAHDGISKCFENPCGLSSADIIRYMYEHQEFHFEQQGIDFPDLWGRPLQLIDCQNLFCEISKYARVAFPDFGGAAGRTRIKQRYSPTTTLEQPTYPPKWGLDRKIRATTTS